MFHTRAPMAYTPPNSPTPAKHAASAKGPIARYDVADEPSRFSLRTVVVIAASLLATGVSLYRIRDTFRQDAPPPNPFQELIKANPEYADLISAIGDHDYTHVERSITKNPWLVNFSLPEGFGPPLMIAAVSNQPDLVDLLIEHGADVNAKGKWGATALHLAAWRGSADAVDALIHHGADINARSDNDASTPLFWACRGSREMFGSHGNHTATVKFLLEAGAAADTLNRDGYSATSIAADNIAALLVQHGAAPHTPATQPTFGNMPPTERIWGFGFGHHFGRRGGPDH
jgi:Ankyrin repeats (many copies)